ncbi:MAG: DUF6508 domain-containing protein [Lachnospiraceae bacterium]|nr:DUF6508 domain-containing protein [Lachnospiraceae bacterium]
MKKEYFQNDRMKAGVINMEELDSIIEYLKINKTVEFSPYPVYSAEIYKALDLLEEDINYLSNHRKIENKSINDMSKKEIATMLTFISRGERFCDGHIAGFVESGDLLKLMLRLKELS